MDPNAIQEIRELIAKHKRWDLIFAGVGLACLSVAALVFIALVADMAIDGAPAYGLLHPLSVAPGQAGILSPVGTTLVMVVTAAAAIPA
jgi:phosphate transport system permease protein